MNNYHENFLIYRGQYYTVYFHAESAETSSASDYLESCDRATQASLLFLIRTIADIGRIYDETKFRYEDKQNKIYCFKPRDERFFCFFFSGKKIIVTSGYTKKKQKLDRNELNKAVKIRREYFS